MAYKYAEIAFTDAVKAEQVRMGSREAYRHREEAKEERSVCIGDDERAFVESADSFFMASIGASGWPYMQHRGGPKGFVRVIGPNRLGFADFRGNKQYISLGNIAGDDRVSLFFIDYPNRARLKLFARASIADLATPELAEMLIVPGYKAKPERFMILNVEAFDWNCPQHITPRYSKADIEALAAMQGQASG